jgi:hypothetical protein
MCSQLEETDVSCVLFQVFKSVIFSHVLDMNIPYLVVGKYNYIQFLYGEKIFVTSLPSILPCIFTKIVRYI